MTVMFGGEINFTAENMRCGVYAEHLRGTLLTHVLCGKNLRFGKAEQRYAIQVSDTTMTRDDKMPVTKKYKMKTIISVKNLTKNYGDFEAVKSISFDVYEGEIFGLLGPNGAGKSTTLEIIETLRAKTSGKVMVNGFDLDTQPEKIKRIISVQLQTSGFYPDLNLTEMID